MEPPEAAPKEWRCGLPSTTLLLFLYLSYLLLGSAAFWALESPRERDMTDQLLKEKWDLLLNFTCLEREALERLSENIIDAYKSGLYLKENTSLGRWDFVGSFFFSVSTVTTIGYGNLSPNTVVSQVFCIFFALFGIPLNLILLNRIGQLMLSGVHLCAFYMGVKFQWQQNVGSSSLAFPLLCFVWTSLTFLRLSTAISSFKYPENMTHMHTPVLFLNIAMRGAVVLTWTCALGTGLLLFLLLPPLLFTVIEGWTYEEGFYYSFITLSTIGFGDYVIGMNPTRTYPGWYKNVVSLWILFGLAWLALLINLCISLVENSSRLCQCCKRKSHNIGHELMNGNPNINLDPEDQQKCGMKDIKPVRLD